jgi:hypothetical protein
MDENYEELFERIRAKCRQQHWYGPDLHNPFQIIKQLQLRQQKAREERERQQRENPHRKGRFVYEGGHGTVSWRDSHGKHYAINAETDPGSLPFQSDFEWPPATEEELADAEKWLRCPLPPLLRALYANVANGGFGPGNGLEGVQSYALWGNLKEGVPYQKRERGVDFSIYLRKYGTQEYFEIPFYVWPERLFCLCDWGCEGERSYLDCVSGRVFYVGVGEDGHGFRAQAQSLYEWLDLWLKGISLSGRMYAGNRRQMNEEG